MLIAASAATAAVGNAWCAQPAGWPEDLGRLASTTVTMTNVSLAGLLEPALVLAPASCSTARMPGPASAAPVSAALIVYQDEKACNSQTALLLLQVSLAARPDDLQHMKDALARHLPAPCFAGNLPQDPRRHAPVRGLVAWRLPGRIVTLAAEAGDDGGGGIIVATSLRSGQGAGGRIGRAGQVVRRRPSNPLSVTKQPAIVRASARRPFLLVPLSLLGGAFLVSLLVVAARLADGPSRGLSNASEACSRIGPLAALAFLYIRLVYVARTKLTIDDATIAFDQPLSGWSVARKQVVGVELAGALTPTHRGGIGAGVRLLLADGQARFIPDVLALPRVKLAALLAPSRQ